MIQVISNGKEKNVKKIYCWMLLACMDIVDNLGDITGSKTLNDKAIKIGIKLCDEMLTIPKLSEKARADLMLTRSLLL